MLVGLEGTDGGDGGHSLGRWRHELDCGTEGLRLWRGLVTGGQTEVTGHLNTEPVRLQVLLTESPTPRSPDVALDHSLSESRR